MITEKKKKKRITHTHTQYKVIYTHSIKFQRDLNSKSLARESRVLTAIRLQT